MSKPPLVTHHFTEGSARFLLELPDVYTTNGSTIGSAMGISRAANNFEPTDNDIAMRVSDGLRTGRLIRLRLSYRTVVDGRDITKSARIVCPTSKVDTALLSLKSKTYKTFNITGAGIPRRRRLG
jgi:hypothetical protein